jgi:hypothetical protein
MWTRKLQWKELHKNAYGTVVSETSVQVDRCTDKCMMYKYTLINDSLAIFAIRQGVHVAQKQ